MDIFGNSPTSGGSVVAWPTREEALGLYEFLSKGDKRDVILLGEPIEVLVHHVKSKKDKILCMAKTGSCEACRVHATSIDVSAQQKEYHAPAMRLKRDRKHHQCIVVFTATMHSGDLSQLMGAEGARGLRLEIDRKTTQTWSIKPVKGSARALSVGLPEGFDILPWVRSRWNLTQDVQKPAVRIAPISLNEIDRGPARVVETLALTQTDRLSAEEYEKTKAKLAEVRAKFQTQSPEQDSAAFVSPPASPPVTTPAPAPTEPEPTPAQTPTPTVVHHIIKSEPVKADAEKLARDKAQREEADRLRRASFQPKDAGEFIKGTLNGLADQFGVPENSKRPSLNGKHGAKKGGGK